MSQGTVPSQGEAGCREEVRHNLAGRMEDTEEGVPRSPGLHIAEEEARRIEDLHTVLEGELRTEVEEVLRSRRRMIVAAEEHYSRLAGSIQSLILHNWGSVHSRRRSG